MTASEPTITVRQAKASDEDAVVGFTTDTWSDREGNDYIPRVFSEWIETDGETQRTFVLDVNDGEDIAGICQAVLLSEYEGWAQGLRVNPTYRGRGVSKQLSNAMFNWCRSQGATVVRAMVFSWNVAGLGQSRSVGFEPTTEFRFTHPEPNADSEPKLTVKPDATAAWSFWQESATRDALRGIALDEVESWSLSALTRAQLVAAADEDRLLTVFDGKTVGFTYRTRTFEQQTNSDSDSNSNSGSDSDTETWAEYAVAAWESESAAEAVYRAIEADAASIGADRTRVLIPESARWVGDTAAARVPIADEPDFVVSANLTDPTIGTR